MPYGTRFDDRIIRSVKSGKVLKTIAYEIGVSHSFVNRRALDLGLTDLVRENVSHFRTMLKLGKPNPRHVDTSKYGKAAIAEHGRGQRTDPEVSRLPHRIRAAKVPLSRHAIAALHERGLTLDELHFATGRPVKALASLIREGARPCA